MTDQGPVSLSNVRKSMNFVSVRQGLKKFRFTKHRKSMNFVSVRQGLKKFRFTKHRKSMKTRTYEVLATFVRSFTNAFLFATLRLRIRRIVNDAE